MYMKSQSYRLWWETIIMQMPVYKSTLRGGGVSDFLWVLGIFVSVFFFSKVYLSRLIIFRFAISFLNHQEGLTLQVAYEPQS